MSRLSVPLSVLHPRRLTASRGCSDDGEDDVSLPGFCATLEVDYRAVLASIEDPAGVGQTREIVVATARRIYVGFADEAPSQYRDAARVLAEGSRRRSRVSWTTGPRNGS